MRRIKEVLRLRYELKLDQRQIARSCSLSVSTVHEYLKRAEAANISWPLPNAWDDARVEAALFEEPASRGKQKKSVTRLCCGAVLTGACRYRSLESILKNSLDQQPLPGSGSTSPPLPPPHDNIRGAEYFE